MTVFSSSTTLRAQVATQLSSVAEAQRMKREQIQRNCNRSAELQAQVGWRGGLVGRAGRQGWRGAALQARLAVFLQARSRSTRLMLPDLHLPTAV